MAKRQRKTKTMSEAIKPTIKKAPKKATSKKKSTTSTSSTKKKVTKKPVTTKKSTTKGKAATKKRTNSTASKSTTKRVTASTPRKRTTKKPVVKKPAAPAAKKVENLKVVPKPKSNKKPVNDNRYVRVSERSKTAKFVEMGEKVQRGEVKWMYYAIDGDIGYHYYLKLKKKK